MGVAERLRPQRWICVRPAAVILLVVLFVADTQRHANTTTEHTGVPLLDWSEWDQPSPVLLRGRTGPITFDAPTMDFVNGSCATGACEQQQLRRLVHECSRRLQASGLTCGDSFVADDDYRVPLIESLPPCGFEAPTTKDAIEHLAARYSFRFIGDSTTRRLTESFMSIVTGEGSTHPKYQARIDFSVGNLKVIFDWAPFCSGPRGVGNMLTAVLAQEAAEEQGDGIKKRPIIITAFGIHDASYQLKMVSHNDFRGWYREQMPQETLKEHGFRAASLAACREATAQFVQAAAGVGATGNEPGADSLLSPEGEEEEEEEEEAGERGLGGGRRTRELRESRFQQRQQRRTTVAEAVPDDFGRGDVVEGSVSVTNNTNDDKSETEVSVPGNAPVNGSRWGALAPPPVVFVLQNNGYYNDPDDFQQMFLDEVHRIQRQEIGIGFSGPEVMGNSTLGGTVKDNDDGYTLGERKTANVDDDGAGVFLVDDSASLYKKLPCYRIEPSSHYHEPIKIVEGKVLWDLIALVDRASGPAPATRGDSSSDVSSSGRLGPALGLAVGMATAAALVGVKL